MANAEDVDDGVLIKGTVDEEIPVLNQVPEYNIRSSGDSDINRSNCSTLMKESGKFEAKESLKTNFQLEDCVEINKDFAQTAVGYVLIPTNTQSSDVFINTSEQNKNIEIVKNGIDEDDKDEDIATSLPAWMKDEIKALDKYR